MPSPAPFPARWYGRRRHGNPGRPKGARNKATVLAERLLSADRLVIGRLATMGFGIDRFTAS
jgi:hypothetical protein